MRTQVLAKVQKVRGGWIANTFGSDGIIGIGAGPTEEDCVASLRQTTADYLVTNGAHWLQQMAQAGTPDVLNCPEGAIKLPADIWVCKVARKTCPIQAQVFMDDHAAFFAGCLLEENRKNAIFKTVTEGRYGGFHHARGRYLCVRCADEKGNDSSFSYHYPWELSSLEEFTPCDLSRNLIEILRSVIKAGLSRATVLNALCARHSIEIATLLYPEVAENLRILEFEVTRPVPRRPESAA